MAFALAPEAPLQEWLEALDRWTENSPGFFAGRPVVLDLKILKPRASEVGNLVAQLAERGIRIYAIEAQGIDSLGPDLPPLLIGARTSVIFDSKAPREQKAAAAPEPKEEPPAPGSLIIQSPIRSGQSVYHPQGDVIVLGSVGSGSEIVAGGSVHVYGTLRGRVFAGATGNAEARIFCRKNEAELLAVDGWYHTAEDMAPSTRGKPIQVFLENGAIQVAALN
ncbi:septum site-determining protein MinC [Phreatobacter stygius]|uniref:Probable septum site-determining protein MinC n=1 Tax=Phreatobacter stygius TaxID=1940610 RepID=A0A4D7BFJ0_9HYPH|nr:septum site-determining protein MinC [Phreatobacter stygius]QCI69395.1 septum formation inhibitor MinC [Phreatobacter stygius]